MTVPDDPFSHLRRRADADACLSDLQLDRLLAGELPDTPESPMGVHLAQCARCRARRVELEAGSRELESLWVTGLATGTLRRLRRWSGFVGIAVAAGLVAVIGFSLAPPDTRLKGDVGLTLHVRGVDGGVRAVMPGDSVSPAEEVRFELTLARPAWLVLLGIDSAGQVSTYFPASGPAVSLPAGRQLLDGSVVLDGVLGSERFIALACERLPSLERVRDAGGTALRLGGGDPAAMGPLELPCAQTSVLVRRVSQP